MLLFVQHGSTLVKMLDHTKYLSAAKPLLMTPATWGLRCEISGSESAVKNPDPGTTSLVTVAGDPW